MEVLVFLVWIGFAAGAGAFAAGRGRSGAGWGFLALLISPLVAFLILAVLPDLASAQAARRERASGDSPAEQVAPTQSLRVQGADVAIRTEKLRVLREKGLLTEPEYLARKQKMLDDLQGKQLVESSEDFLALLIPLIDNGGLTADEVTKLKAFAFQEAGPRTHNALPTRWDGAAVAPPGWRCPTCGQPAVQTTNRSSYVCENMHVSPVA